MAVVRAFLIGCAVLLVVGCAGVRSEATKQEQTRLPEATASEEEARCEGTRTYHAWYVVYPNGAESSTQSGSTEDMKKAAKRAGKVGYKFVEGWEGWVVTTNDLPGCPKGGLLLGTDSTDALYGDALYGKEGDDEIRGLGERDSLLGGAGNDVILGGAGNDELRADQGEDVLYGGDGNDFIVADDGQRDKLYCGEGKDIYAADKKDYVDSSCEKPAPSQAID